MQFGEKLRKIRQERNLTQPDLAEQLGIEQSWLSKLENDKSLPSSELLDRVCQVFHITLEQLVADLDTGYVQQQLASLPEVRGLLQEKRYTLVHNARRWLLGGAALVAVGVTLFLSGNYHWLFTEVLFRYESQGIVFASEPEHLFDNADEVLMSIAVTQVDQSWAQNSADRGWIEKNLLASREAIYKVEYEKNRAKLHQRSSLDVQMHDRHLGSSYRIETTAAKDSTDIFGNTVTAGSPAHRIYTTRGSSPNPRWQNGLFKVLGVFLATVGALLYLVEWRIGRVIKTA